MQNVVYLIVTPRVVIFRRTYKHIDVSAIYFRRELHVHFIFWIIIILLINSQLYIKSGYSVYQSYKCCITI